MERRKRPGRTPLKGDEKSNRTGLEKSPPELLGDRKTLGQPGGEENHESQNWSEKQEKTRKANNNILRIAGPEKRQPQKVVCKLVHKSKYEGKITEEYHQKKRWVATRGRGREAPRLEGGDDER